MSAVRHAFEDRHIGPDSGEIKTMPSELGESTLDPFIAKVVLSNIAIPQTIIQVLPTASSEV